MAVACEDGLHVYSLAEQRLLRTILPRPDAPWPTVFGFDPADRGVFVAFGPDTFSPNASYQLDYCGIDGVDIVLALARVVARSAGGAVGPPFAYIP